VVDTLVALPPCQFRHNSQRSLAALFSAEGAVANVPTHRTCPILQINKILMATSFTTSKIFKKLEELK